MSFWFDRPIGAHADVHELEYIAALHQSIMPELRPNGSIYAEDIVDYVMSRHGIHTTVEVVNDYILNGLAGNLLEAQQQPPLLDPVQMASILLIPLLQRQRAVVDSSSLLLEDDHDVTHDDDVIAVSRDLFQRIHALFLASLPLADDDHERNDKGQLILTPWLLQTFLEEHGECHVPPQMIQDMMARAVSFGSSTTTTTKAVLENKGDDDDDDDNKDHSPTTTTTPPPQQPPPSVMAVPFTVEVLMHALTSDLERYDPSRELQLSTHFQDALASVIAKPDDELKMLNQDVKEASAKIGSDDDDDDDEEDVKQLQAKTTGDEDKYTKNFQESTPLLFEKVYTAPSIDHAADTFASPIWVVVVWLLLIMLYVAYVARITGESAVGLSCGKVTEHDTNVRCHFVNGIITWIVIFFQLTIIGVLFVTLTSLGNSVNDQADKPRRVARLLVAIVTTFVTCILSYLFQVRTFFFDTYKKGAFTVFYIGSVILGVVLMAFQVLELMRVLLGDKFWQEHPKLQRYSIGGSIRMETSIKSAAVFKVNQMVQNALEIHNAASIEASTISVRASSKRNAMFHFQKLEHQTVPAGGILWAWKLLKNGTLFSEEGVWLHARLIACNVMQLIITIAVFVGWIIFIILFRFDNAKFDNAKKYVTLAEIDVSVSAGAIAAVLGCAAITIVFIPSFIGTCVQFRTGLIPSLGSKTFRAYRFSEDTTALLFGGSFWGVLSTAFACWALVGGVAFIVVWHKTRTIVLIIISNIVGFLITYFSKVAVLQVLRKHLHGAFYRKRPAFANIVSLALECWYLALTSGFILVRSSKLLLVNACYLGRIDTPVLAPGVGVVGPVIFDGFPVIFRKDLLVHDAHRHPYMERLGMMYTMKLLHGDSFADRPGSCWRLLMVLVLMPWLRKHRIRLSGPMSQLQFEQPMDEAAAIDDEEFQREPMLLDNMSQRDREVEMLRQRIRLQEEENEELRELLKKATQST